MKSSARFAVPFTQNITSFPQQRANLYANRAGVRPQLGEAADPIQDPTLKWRAESREAAQAGRAWGVCTDGRGLAHGEGSVTRPTKLRRDPSEARMLIVCSKNFLQGPTLEFSDQPLPSGNWRGHRVRTTSLPGEQMVRWARRSWEGAWRHTCCARCFGPGAKGAPSITVQRLPLQAPPTSYPAPSSGFRDCLGRI